MKICYPLSVLCSLSHTLTNKHMNNLPWLSVDPCCHHTPLGVNAAEDREHRQQERKAEQRLEKQKQKEG